MPSHCHTLNLSRATKLLSAPTITSESTDVSSSKLFLEPLDRLSFDVFVF